MFCLGKKSAQMRKTKKKKLVWAELLEVTSPAKVREKSKVRSFSEMRRLPLQHIPATEQLRLKRDILRETLSRLGGVSWDGTIVEHSAGRMAIEIAPMGGAKRMPGR